MEVIYKLKCSSLRVPVHSFIICKFILSFLKASWKDLEIFSTAHWGHIEGSIWLLGNIFKVGVSKGIYNRLPLITSYLLDIDLAL